MSTVAWTKGSAAPARDVAARYTTARPSIAVRGGSPMRGPGVSGALRVGGRRLEHGEATDAASWSCQRRRAADRVNWKGRAGVEDGTGRQWLQSDVGVETVTGTARNGVGEEPRGHRRRGAKGAHSHEVSPGSYTRR